MKISENQAILQLVALAREHKIQHVVLCPGSRNAAITHAFVAAGTFKCYSIVDERSAGFFALGIAQRTGTPVAVCVTSGTALLNLHPAVAEAFYQELPLVVVSADRPRAWIGQLDGQTLPQPRVFGELVKFSADLPTAADAESRWHCNRLLNEAFLAATFRGNGPVHINVPLAEPLFNFTENAFPQPRVIRRSRGDFPLKNFQKRMLICGQILPKSVPAKPVPALNFPGFVCLAEHLSNGRVAGTIGNFDEILARASDSEKRALAPDLLVTIGGHIVSKNLKKFLRAFPPREHWHISSDGKIADTFGCLTAALAGTPEAILADANELRGNPFCQFWKAESKAVPATKPANLRERAVAALMKFSAGNNLYLANSSSVRLAQKFPCKARAVFCNRGTSGIEGTLSAALGGNAISGEFCENTGGNAVPEPLDFVLIGDLSFFYDMNSLAAGTLNSRLRILLLNDAGGAIFRAVPGVPVDSPAGKFICATPRERLSAEAWARSRGFEYFAVSRSRDLPAAMRVFADPAGTRPVFVEVLL